MDMEIEKSGGAGVVDIRAVFETEEAARQFVAAYEDRYHPAGYGTTLGVRSWVAGEWIVSGSRYSNCD